MRAGLRRIRDQLMLVGMLGACPLALYLALAGGGPPRQGLLLVALVCAFIGSDRLYLSVLRSRTAAVPGPAEPRSPTLRLCR